MRTAEGADNMGEGGLKVLEELGGRLGDSADFDRAI